MSPDTQIPDAALAKAQTILLSVDWCYCRNDTIHLVCDTHRYIAAALDAYAAERIEEATDGDRTFARLAQVERERDAALAKLETAESCTTCDGLPHASGSICICGGSGRRSDETMNLRQLAQATQSQLDITGERVRVLVEAARQLCTELDNPNWPGNDDAIHQAVSNLNAALAKAAPEPTAHEEEHDAHR